MRKILLLPLILGVLLSGCRVSERKPETQAVPPTETAASMESAAPVETSAPTASGVTIYPLPDTTMDNLSDAILAVSLSEGDAYVDDTGKMQMDLTIYTYDKYDLVDISYLKEGDTIVTHAGAVEITSLQYQQDGTICINGGLYEDGFDLDTDDSGVYYECGYNDTKNWHEIGKATIRVSADFEYHDTSDLELGEVLYFPGSFLIGEVTNYDFTPYNTTIRVENGQIIEMHRVYVP